MTPYKKIFKESADNLEDSEIARLHDLINKKRPDFSASMEAEDNLDTYMEDFYGKLDDDFVAFIGDELSSKPQSYGTFKDQLLNILESAERKEGTEPRAALDLAIRLLRK